jgi:hypothetical protein
MDMESGEQGLVPEEYVRLLSEIEGWGEHEHLEGVEEEEDAGSDDELAEEVHSQSQAKDTDAGGKETQKSMELPVRGDKDVR